MDMPTSAALFYQFGSVAVKILNDDKLRGKDATGVWSLAYWVSLWSLSKNSIRGDDYRT